MSFGLVEANRIRLFNWAKVSLQSGRPGVDPDPTGAAPASAGRGREEWKSGEIEKGRPFWTALPFLLLDAGATTSGPPPISWREVPGQPAGAEIARSTRRG